MRFAELRLGGRTKQLAEGTGRDNRLNLYDQTKQ
jgi:hypothetical protein